MIQTLTTSRAAAKEASMVISHRAAYNVHWAVKLQLRFMAAVSQPCALTNVANCGTGQVPICLGGADAPEGG